MKISSTSPSIWEKITFIENAPAGGINLERNRGLQESNGENISSGGGGENVRKNEVLGGSVARFSILLLSAYI